jgi:hypothetical protein
LTTSLKAWLRAQHAQSIRERKRGAQPRDFDLIGTEFHRWVRDHEQPLGLTSSAAFGSFVEEDFAFYARWYQRIRSAAELLTEGLEAIHFNAQNNFTLQYPVLLAPILRSDSEDEILRKLRIVSSYLDILIARRIWNWKATDYSTMQYSMFQLVILRIRGKGAEELAAILTERLATEPETLATNDRFRLHGMNGRQIHRLLARMTDCVETSSGQASRYSEYINRRGNNGYEVEHIWANHADRHEDEFSHPADFSDLSTATESVGCSFCPRVSTRAMATSPMRISASTTLGRTCWHRASMRRLTITTLASADSEKNRACRSPPLAEFKKADLDGRQDLYRQIAEQIWNPEILLAEVEA